MLPVARKRLLQARVFLNQKPEKIPSQVCAKETPAYVMSVRQHYYASSVIPNASDEWRPTPAKTTKPSLPIYIREDSMVVSSGRH